MRAAAAIATGPATATMGCDPGVPEPSRLPVASGRSTGEPLAVAGAFTLDGLGASFVRRVDGDPAAVVGLSLAALRASRRRLSAEVTVPGGPSADG